ncbi:unknown [Clostridium sp. CAG:448]|nr:unknown [Clostridium sp. CAG:448]
MSDTGMDQSTPESPKKRGKSRANPTPNTISRTMESRVDSTALPIACKKMKVALLTQARTIMHR